MPDSRPPLVVVVVVADSRRRRRRHGRGRLYVEPILGLRWPILGLLGHLGDLCWIIFAGTFCAIYVDTGPSPKNVDYACPHGARI